MIWILFGLLGGLSKSLLDLMTKRLMARNDEYIVTWARFTFGVPFILLLFLLFYDIPYINQGYWLVIAFVLPLEVIGMLMYMRAIRISPLSLTIPLLGFTPMFILLSGYLLISEIPSMLGIAGIMLIVAGSYLLGLGKGFKSVLSPIRSLIKEKGPILMFIVAIIYSLTPVLAKMGSTRSSFIFYAVTVFCMLSIIYSLIIYHKSEDILETTRKNLFQFTLIGIISACEFIFILLAFNYALVNYVMAAKRSSIIFSVIFGYIFFKENNISYRILASSVIFLGLVLVALA